MDNEYAVGAEALSNGPQKTKAPRKRVVEIHAKKVKGGYSVQTYHNHPANPMEESVHPDLKSVENHMESKWGASEAPETSDMSGAGEAAGPEIPPSA